MRATTCLAANTDLILRELASHLTKATGAAVHFDETEAHADRRRAVETGMIDMVWACGLLTVELIRAHRLDADIVAAPIFEGEASPVYHSVLIARKDHVATVHEARGLRFAINDSESWSGRHGFASHLVGLGLTMDMFGDSIVTGSHHASILAVRDDRADVAAIDHTVWHHLLRSGDDVAGVVVIGRTDDWPAPPFSISKALGPDDRSMLVDALGSIGPGQIAGLDGVRSANLATYADFQRA